MKKIVMSVCLLAVMVLTIVSCAKPVDMAKLSGVWTAETIDGKSVEDFCAENTDFTPEQITTVLTVSADKAVLSINGNDLTFKVDAKTDGFECLNEKDNSIFMSVKYDEANNKLFYKCTIAEGKTVEYVAVKAAEDEGSDDEEAKG